MCIWSFISSPRLFPVAIIVLEGLAALRWAAAKDWAQAAYWLFATGLVTVVTFGMGK